MKQQVESVERQIRDILDEECCIDEIGQNDKFEDEGMDSLDHCEFIMALEQHFDIEIPDDDADGICTLQQAVAYIEKRKAQ